MARMSARFIAPKLGQSTSWVYKIWEEMGFVVQNKFGEWILTEAGRINGGKMSSNPNHCTPTFDFDSIVELMANFLNNKKK